MSRALYRLLCVVLFNPAATAVHFTVHGRYGLNIDTHTHIFFRAKWVSVEKPSICGFVPVDTCGLCVITVTEIVHASPAFSFTQKWFMYLGIFNKSEGIWERKRLSGGTLRRAHAPDFNELISKEKQREVRQFSCDVMSRQTALDQMG